MSGPVWATLAGVGFGLFQSVNSQAIRADGRALPRRVLHEPPKQGARATSGAAESGAHAAERRPGPAQRLPSRPIAGSPLVH